MASIARDGALRVWEVATGKAAGVWELVTHGGASVAWDPAGKRIAVTCLDAIHIWEVGKREPVLTLRAHRGDVRALAWNGCPAISTTPNFLPSWRGAMPF